MCPSAFLPHKKLSVILLVKYRAEIWKFSKSSWVLWILSTSTVKCTVPKSEQSCGGRSGSREEGSTVQNRRQWASKLSLLHLWKHYCCIFLGRQKAGRFYCQDLEEVTHCKKAKNLTELLQPREQKYQLTGQGLEPISLTNLTLDLINTMEQCAEHAVHLVLVFKLKTIWLCNMRSSRDNPDLMPQSAYLGPKNQNFANFSGNKTGLGGMSGKHSNSWGNQWSSSIPESSERNNQSRLTEAELVPRLRMESVLKPEHNYIYKYLHNASWMY